MTVPTLLAVVAILACAVQAQVVKFTPCNGVSDSVCSVSEVRIHPGKIKKRYTEITKGQKTELAFDFTPNFAAQSLKSGLFWDDGTNDVEFEALKDADACTLTSCPVAPGKSQTLTYSLLLGVKLPKGIYPIKWKLWNANDKSQICCFRTTLKLKQEGQSRNH